MFDVNAKEAAKVLVDEAATTLVPALVNALAPIIAREVETLAREVARIGPALVDELDGLMVTITIARKAKV